MPTLEVPSLTHGAPCASLGRPDTDLKSEPLVAVWFLRLNCPLSWKSMGSYHTHQALFLSEHAVCLGLTDHHNLT